MTDPSSSPSNHRVGPGFDSDTLAAWADSGTQILTRTRRLARSLALRIAELRAEQGRRVAESPQVALVDDWVGEKWTAWLGDRDLLSGPAETRLWTQIISGERKAASEDGSDVSELAREAAVAWARIHEWADPPWESEWLSEDAAAFLRWATEFREALKTGNFITAAELAPALCTELERDAAGLPLPERIVLLGFENFEPVLERLAKALKSAGVKVEVPETPPPTARLDLSAYADRKAEIRAVSEMVREDLLADPTSRIGVLSADLNGYWPALEDALREALDPRSLLPGGSPLARAFDVSRAPALSHLPLVAVALDVLALERFGNDFARSSRVLLSPYPRALDARGDGRADTGRDAGGDASGDTSGGTGRDTSGDASGGTVGDTSRDTSRDAATPTENDAVERRALVECALRRANRSVVDLAGPRGLVEICEANAASEFAARCAELDRLIEGEPSVASPGEWANHFRARLIALGWPGPGLDHGEGLAFRRWCDALLELRRIGVVASRVSRAEALSLLQDITGSMQVQPASAGLGLQVLDLLESAGLAFDKVYLLGMTDTVFPAPPRPLPLLPLGWQRAQGMRSSSAALELDFARKVRDRILASTPLVRASYPATGDQGEALRPSALLAAQSDADRRASGEAGATAEAAGAAEAGRTGEKPESGAAAGADAKTALVSLSDPAVSLSFDPPGFDPSRVLEPRPEPRFGPARVRLGGTRLLVGHMQCPFKAFAAERLDAAPLEEPLPEPTPRTLGSLVHEALEAGYRELGHSDALLAADDSTLDELAARVVADMFSQTERRSAVSAVPLVLRDATREWLHDLALAWFQEERAKTKAPRRYVGFEEPCVIRVGPSDASVELSGRIDRIDELEDGSRVIVDYKTAASGVTPMAWVGERMRDAQLPLYAIALADAGTEVGGLVYGEVAKRDKVAVRGLARDDLGGSILVPGTKGAAKLDWEGWDEVLPAFRRAASQASAAFLGGASAPDPLDGMASCRLCAREALCRIFERPVEDPDEFDQEELVQ